jgi:hypothetical protein
MIAWRGPGARFLLAAVLASTALCRATAGAAPPAGDAVTERVRAILREDGGDSTWGADPPAQEIASRGEPVAASALSGAGHGSSLRLLHVSVEGDHASVSECVLDSQEEHLSCPPPPLVLVDCAAWSVPADAARSAMQAARAALFVRVYEKNFIGGPSEESVDGGAVPGGFIGGASGSSVDFVAVANVIESGEYPVRVEEEWAGYRSSHKSGRYARADAAAAILREAFPRPSDAPASPPSPAVHAEFSRLFATLPLDADFWWWVRERMVLMAGTLGLPADLEQLKRYLTPQRTGPSESRTLTYALEALARRTGRDTRCDGGRRLADATAAAAWAH